MEVEVLNHVFCIEALIEGFEEGDYSTVKRLKKSSHARRKVNKLDMC